MKSIRTKLLVSFLVLVILLIFVLSFISINTGKKLLLEKAEESVELMAENGAKVVELKIQHLIDSLAKISVNSEMHSKDTKKLLAFMKDELKDTEFLDIAIVMQNGNAYYTDGTSSQLDDRDYIKKAFEGVSNVSDVIISRVTNEPVVMVAVPVMQDKDVARVLIGRMDGNALSDIAKDSGYGENGFAFMVSSTGNIVAHPEKEMVLEGFNPAKASGEDEDFESFGSAVSTMLEKQSGNITYELMDRTLENSRMESYYCGYYPVQGTNWIFVNVVDEGQIFSAIPQLQKNILVSATIFLVISAILIILMGNAITAPMIKLTKVSKRVADLDVRDDVPDQLLNWPDENGVLAKSIQEIIGNIRTIMKEITNSSNMLSTTAEELTATTKQSAQASEEVAKTVEEIARGAAEQASNTETGSQHAIDLGDLIEENRSYMDSMNQAAGKVTEVVEDGLTDVEKLFEITKQNNLAIQEIHEIILKTKESSARIGGASNVITEIASQTNLLSLNASIEASRAGEAGKGFAVVADEIKKLAEQSTASTKEIDSIIMELNNIVEKAVNSISKVITITREQAASVSDTKSKYHAITTAIGETEEATKKLNESEREMITAKNNILDMMQTLSAIAEENAAGTQEASAAMEEQSASMEEIASSSKRLTELAQNLQAIIVRFKA